MGSLKQHSSESIKAVIEQMEKDLKSLKISRKVRSDNGGKRSVYKSNLPLRYRQYLASANKRSIDFKLTVEEFIIITNGNCVYCGSSHKTGVDRIDSSDSYHIENCQPCCGTCNLMKFRHFEEDFIKQIINIVKHRNLNYLL